jgi:hypothetical protein
MPKNIIIIVIGLFILTLTSCRLFLPSRILCNQLYPVQYKDTTIIKKDTVKIPYFVYTPGDTIFLSGKVDRPCADSVAQWNKFTGQINAIFNQNKKYKQQINFLDSTFKYELRVSNDSVLFYKTLYTIEKTKTKSILTPVPYPKTPTWSWWTLTGCIIMLLSIIIGIILKFAK